MSNNCVISIITVTYNVENVLQRTLSSIQSQSAFDGIEHIIVDGNSTDGTLSIIENNTDKISQWISEPDKGLYDAMNKGIEMATGDYLWFINAGDELYDSTTAQKLIHYIQTNETQPDVLYGDTKEYTQDGEELGLRRLKVPENLNWESFKQGMLVCHQSILVKRAIAPKYDLTYKISADVDWVINALKASSCIVNVHLVLSKFEKGGLSRKHLKRALKERFTIMHKHYGLLSTSLRHLYFPIRLFAYYAKNKRI